MKKKTTRKIRKNKRTTQRRNNRSYKRMRGGMLLEKNLITKLLTNLIINNTAEETIRQLCYPQSLLTTDPPLLPTVDQPLLPTVKQSLLLKNAEQVNQRLINIYKPTNNIDGKFKYQFDKTDTTTNSILSGLKTKNISYFDLLIDENRVVDILSPDEFRTSLTSLTSPSLLKRMFIKDKLVNSMFFLAAQFIAVYPLVDNNGTGKINLDEPVCPPIADI